MYIYIKLFNFYFTFHITSTLQVSSSQWKHASIKVPQASPMCDLHLFPCWHNSAGKRRNKIFKETRKSFCSSTAPKPRTPSVVRPPASSHNSLQSRLCSLSGELFTAPSKSSQQYIHTLNELRTKEICWLTHKRLRPEAHNNLTVVLSPSPLLLRTAIGLGWGEDSHAIIPLSDRKPSSFHMLSAPGREA